MLCLSPAEAAKRAPAGVQEAFGPDPCRIWGKSFFWGLSPLGKAISDTQAQWYECQDPKEHYSCADPRLELHTGREPAAPLGINSVCQRL